MFNKISKYINYEALPSAIKHKIVFINANKFKKLTGSTKIPKFMEGVTFYKNDNSNNVVYITLGTFPRINNKEYNNSMKEALLSHELTHALDKLNNKWWTKKSNNKLLSSFKKFISEYRAGKNTVDSTNYPMYISPTKYAISEAKDILTKKAAIQYTEAQKRIADKLKTSPGLVLYWGLGSGKTLASINAAEQEKSPATVITPASLQENYKKELHKAKANPKNYRIMSYDKFNNLPITQNDSGTLILDEAHKIKNEKTKTSKTILEKRPRYSKALLLTGTPIQNYPYEIAPLIDTAANKQILPLNPKTFNSWYINKQPIEPGILSKIFSGAKTSYIDVPKNLKDFKNRSKKYVDYYADSNDKDYPTRIDKTVIVPMDKEQVELNDYYTKKLPSSLQYQIKKSLPPNKQDVGKLNSFISATRQLSNTAEAFKKTDVDSPKIKTIVEQIKKSKRPSLVYSNYLTSGILPVAEQLDKAKIKNGIYTGKLTSTQKNELVKQYNNGKLKALLISSAGGEGLDLKDTGAVHIMEPHWNEPKIDQVIGRAIRYKSHSNLPKNERNVTVYKYISNYPKKKQGAISKFLHFPKSNKVSADEYLLNLSKRKEELNNSFLNIFKDDNNQ